MGMGRGPGNTKTEELIKFFYEKENFKNDSIKKLLKIFSKLKQKYKWGTNVFYQLSGKYKIHPTYIQNMLADSRYEKDDYFKAIKYLKNNDAKSYNPFALLSAFNIYKFTEKTYSKKNYNLVSKYFSQVLILGPGNELNKIKINLEKNKNNKNTCD